MSEVTSEEATLNMTLLSLTDNLGGNQMNSRNVPDIPRTANNKNTYINNEHNDINPILSSLKNHHKKLNNPNKQHSTAILISLDSKMIILSLFEPKPDNNCSGKKNNKNTHSEKFLIAEITNILEENPKVHQDGRILIYSTNSPCLIDKGCDSCMSLIQENAKEWYRLYSIKTIVLFTKWYGNTGFSKTILDKYNINFHYLINSKDYKSWTSENGHLVTPELYQFLKDQFNSISLTFNISDSFRNYLLKKLKNPNVSKYFTSTGSLQDFRNEVNDLIQEGCAIIEKDKKDSKKYRKKWTKILNEYLEKEFEAFLKRTAIEALNKKDVTDYITNNYFEYLSFYFTDDNMEKCSEINSSMK
ncbi:hypothetical protein DPEC_G00024370 [Dallia pectoralis]|uniref:Uncharacterized protein n=1 Tax=Dallia pectoralis TaxID=75939 RepID=A0ACC2HGZ7_DALPE|nr:hypothetical protein DPEC_G00024370 [Dallia pectoralis]